MGNIEINGAGPIHIDKVILNGVEFDLVPNNDSEDFIGDGYDYSYEAVTNPFNEGDYVRVVTPKRNDHRLDEHGKVICQVPEDIWDSEDIPEVYVEFPTPVQGCGEAGGRVASRHGCRMPVTGLVAVL